MLYMYEYNVPCPNLVGEDVNWVIWWTKIVVIMIRQGDSDSPYMYGRT